MPLLSRLIRVFLLTIIDPPLGRSMRVAYNDEDDRAVTYCAVMCNFINKHTHIDDGRLLGYVQFNKYTLTNTHSHTHTS